MRKTVLIMCAVLCALFLLTGCGGNKDKASGETESPSGSVRENSIFGKNSGAPSNSYGQLSKSTIELFNSKRYYMKYRLNNAASPEDSQADLEVFIKDGMIANKSELNGGVFRNVTRNGSFYTIIPEQNMALRMEIPTHQEYNPGIIETEDIVFKESGTTDLAGIMLPYDEYSSKGSDALRFIFNGHSLAGIQILTGEEVILSMDVMELSGNVPDEAFEIPEGYTIVDAASA